MKHIASILLIMATQIVLSQGLEFGPMIGKRSANLEDSRVTEGKAVIGKAFWSTDKGVSVVYYFRDRYVNSSSAIQLAYMSTTRGSRSEVFPQHNISFDASSIQITYRYSNNLGSDFSTFFDVGVSFNKLETENIYHGSRDELRAFPKLKAPLAIKENDAGFLAGMGVDKRFLKKQVVVFAQVGLEASIFKINRDSGSFRNTSLTAGVGLRYALDLMNSEKLENGKI